MAKDHDDLIAIGVKMDVLQTDMKTVERDIRGLTESLNRYKGIIGGVMLWHFTETAIQWLLLQRLHG